MRIRRDSFAKHMGIEFRFWKRDHFYILQADYSEELLSKGFRIDDKLKLKLKLMLKLKLKPELEQKVNMYKEVSFTDIESAYWANTFCKYKGFKFFVENASHRKYTLRPLEEAMNHFNDFPKQAYDPVYEADENEIEELWEERKPIDGFVFDTEPIIYIKRKIES
jgi:hypothetical protein